MLRGQSAVFRYSLPFAAVLSAVALIHVIGVFDPESPYFLMLLIFAVVSTAWYGGSVPGWIAVAFATIIVDYYLISPRRELNLDQRILPWSFVFLLCAVASNMVSLRRRRIEQELRHARDQLDERVRQRTAQLNSAYDMLKSEIDERTRAEAAQRQAEQDLARANRAVAAGVLTASIAHEINQPLAAAATNANAALNWLRREPPCLKEAKNSVVAMIAAVDRASAVIAEIRGLIGNRQTQPEKVNLNDVIEDTLSLVRRDIVKRKIDLKVDLNRALPAAYASSVALQQVVLNLLANGVEAMEGVSGRPKELIVRTEILEDDRACVTIEDSGIGFDKSDTERLFHPFYSTKSNGIGMGLAICRSIMERFGGHIAALPRQPRGATFRMILPIARDVS